MQYIAQTIEQLGRKASTIASKRALVGLDGFVDKIMAPVATRSGLGEAFTPMASMSEFGQRILDFAGKSCNIELFPRMEKLGGNGPIMANALVGGGMKVRYIGALGDGSVHPVFEEFAAHTSAVSLCDPGITNALEFEDGKILLGQMASLDLLSYERIVEVMGEGAFFDEISRCDLIAMTNWTMIPRMTEVFEAMLDKVLPNLPPKDGGRLFFFDLADPKKRSEGDIRTVLEVIGRFRGHGRVTLGLNHAESQQVAKVLGIGEIANTEHSLREGAAAIRNALEITCVVIHPREGAACATKEGSYYTDGPLCEKPLISTGAGDHFNAGFVTGQVLGLSPEACLTVAVSFSGQYVRTAKSPNLTATDSFLRNWKK
ncbi:MAG: carbohydrate kinase family protein [Opitutales bacterium]|nr:carbohydrate kinase family protein [Opitutales bacterium]